MYARDFIQNRRYITGSKIAFLSGLREHAHWLQAIYDHRLSLGSGKPNRTVPKFSLRTETVKARMKPGSLSLEVKLLLYVLVVKKVVNIKQHSIPVLSQNF